MGAYVLTSILLVYSHYCAFLVIAAQIVFAVVEIAGTRDRKLVRRMSWAFGAIGAAALPAVWLMSRYVTAGAPGVVGWMKRPERTDLLFVRQAGALLGDELLCVVVLLAVAVALRNGASGEQRNPASPRWWAWWSERRATMLCLLWIVFGLYSLVLVSYAVRPIYMPRYSLPVEVPLAALIGAGLCRVRMPWPRSSAGALCCMRSRSATTCTHRRVHRLIATPSENAAQSLSSAIARTPGSSSAGRRTRPLPWSARLQTIRTLGTLTLLEIERRSSRGVSRRPPRAWPERAS